MTTFVARRGPWRARAGVGAAVVLLAACGTAGSDASGPSPTPTPTSDGVVTSLEGVRGATVQVVATDTFTTPEEGPQDSVAGSGSGLLVDSSGLTVTNNHVVAGAAKLEVFVGGDTAPHNARVVAASECSDLAVIDVDGEGYPYLGWRDEPVDVGLEIYAAGFPLGDPEFTLTKGIVSKAATSGETSWASVEAVLQHDATINPGNSGGPLVDADGAVVGVNYASNDEADQYFAISQPVLTTVVERLRGGTSDDWLGINAEAVTDEETGLAGVWVAAVESGSPAATLGLQSGDVITKLEGLSLATDGTLADYCDVLRTQGNEAVISAQVYRPGTDEFLAGSFNEQPLAPADFGGQVQGDGGQAGGQQAYADYVSVVDDTETLWVEVPQEWAEVDGGPGREGGAALVASPDLEAFGESFSVSGVELALLPGERAVDTQATLTEILSSYNADAACTTTDGPQPYEDPLYTGSFEIRDDCEGSGARVVAIVASPEGSEYALWVMLQITVDADYEALDRVIASFRRVQ